MICKYFDVLLWWKLVGKTKYPLISLVASHILVTPDSNGYQEHAFSFCTFIDDVLCHHLDQKKYEMQALLGLN